MKQGIDMAIIPMSFKELREGRRVGIPESIIGKMAIGIEPNEREKEIIKNFGKVYVEAHKKDGKWVKPQLRDLPEGKGGMGQRYTKRNELDDKINYLIDDVDLKVIDNKGETMDRYTVVIEGQVYGMSDNPLSPMGFNQWSGEEYEFQEWLGEQEYLSKKEILNLPKDVKKAIWDRYGED